MSCDSVLHRFFLYYHYRQVTPPWKHSNQVSRHNVLLCLFLQILVVNPYILTDIWFIPKHYLIVIDPPFEYLSQEDISDLLTSLGLGQYLQLVASKTIRGNFLGVCDDIEDLKTLGINDDKLARVLLKEITRRRCCSG